jgi:hypothetical protein
VPADFPHQLSELLQVLGMHRVIAEKDIQFRIGTRLRGTVVAGAERSRLQLATLKTKCRRHVNVLAIRNDMQVKVHAATNQAFASIRFP